MKDLIEALTIFAKYKNKENPTHCEHDVLYVVGITDAEVTEVDRARLEILGFFYDNDTGWKSYRFGSA